MVRGLICFINDLRKSIHEIILLLDDNETFSYNKCILAKLVQQTNITDSIFNKYDSSLKSITYKRDSQRIDFCFCTPHIEKYLIRCGITPFDLFTSTDHREIYLNINILLYLKQSFTNPLTPDSQSRDHKLSEVTYPIYQITLFTCSICDIA